MRVGDPLAEFVVVRMVQIRDFERAPEGAEFFLGTQDRERAGKFRFPEDRMRFVVGRWLLGRCLAEFAGWVPGPPELDLHFSLSHSRDWVAIALARESRVGVDIEYMAPQLEPQALAKRILSAKDFKAFLALPEEQKLPAFFAAWTTKEACLKAKGVGLGGGLKRITVPDLEDDGAQARRGGALGAGWMFQRLPVPENYAGCVVWKARAKAVNFAVMEWEAQA
jgi:4'-phosphopantetheinyl transferase